VFIEVNNGRVRAFFREENRDRASDPAVAPGDERNLVPQLSATDIITGAGFWLRPHPVFAAGLPFLMLRRASFFSFAMVRIIRFSTSFQMFPPLLRIAPKEIFIFSKKNRFSRLTVFF
jgi:hypothetical protein